MRCCRAAEQTDHSSLSRKLEEEKQLLAKYLDKQYKDIMENFDPKIVRFRKKHKVIFHRDSGLDELLD
jgi:Fe-S-cluster formation regulator IscX/YfhJ